MRTILLLHRCWMKCLINWRWAWPTGQKLETLFDDQKRSVSARKLSFFSTLWQMLPKDAISHSGTFSICKAGWNLKGYHPIFLKMMLSNKMWRLKLILFVFLRIEPGIVKYISRFSHLYCMIITNAMFLFLWRWCHIQQIYLKSDSLKKIPSLPFQSSLKKCTSYFKLLMS